MSLMQMGLAFIAGGVVTFICGLVGYLVLNSWGAEDE